MLQVNEEDIVTTVEEENSFDIPTEAQPVHNKRVSMYMFYNFFSSQGSLPSLLKYSSKPFLIDCAALFLTFLCSTDEAVVNLVVTSSGVKFEYSSLLVVNILCKTQQVLVISSTFSTDKFILPWNILNLLDIIPNACSTTCLARESLKLKMRLSVTLVLLEYGFIICVCHGNASSPIIT